MSRFVRNSLLMSVAGCLALTLPALAQDQEPTAPPKWDKTYEPPRLPDGTPSFEGVWSKASLTVLERSPQFKSLAIEPAVARDVVGGRRAVLPVLLHQPDPAALHHP